MKILMVCDVLGEENNGTTIATMNLLNYLKHKGHEVRVLCADKNKKGQPGYYVVKNLNLGRILNKYVAKAGVTLAKPEKLIIEEAMVDVDLVHVMLPFALTKAAVKIAKRKGIPVTAGFHCQAENFTSYIKLNHVKYINHLFYKYLYHSIYRHVDAIHYPSLFIKNLFESHIKRPTNGYIISNGVRKGVEKKDISKPDELKDKYIILSTGRYSREKSQDTLIKAIEYSKYKDKIQLILAGQGTREKYYKKLAKNLPVTPIFKFFKRDEIVDVINYSDIYVHPAEMELEGIACLEAIACGKLVIVSSSKLSATKGFAVNEKCVFENRNPKNLAQVIDYFIENENERLAYGNTYLNSAEIYDQEKCMQKMEDMMNEVCNHAHK